jgi:hypothetical protein
MLCYAIVEIAVIVPLAAIYLRYSPERSLPALAFGSDGRQIRLFGLPATSRGLLNQSHAGITSR